MPFVRVSAASWESPLPPAVPYGLRAPFHWHTAGLGPAAPGGGAPLLLRFPEEARRHVGRPARLRFTVALPYTEAKTVALFGLLPGAPRYHNAAVVRFAGACPLDTFEIALPADMAASVLTGGAMLRQTEGHDLLYVLVGAAVDAETLRPHLLFDTDDDPLTYGERIPVLFDRMLSPMDAARPFGLAAGAVLDALLDLHAVVCPERARPALRRYLSAYFDPDRLVVREAPDGSPGDGRLYGVADTLPFAALALTEPHHPALRLARAYWAARAAAAPHEDGLILSDDGRATAEAVYTVAYPMAAVAHALGRQDIEWAAVRQMLLTRNRLWAGDGLYGRSDDRGFGDAATRGEAHGLACYLIGMARALPFLSHADAADEVGAALRQACDFALRLQRADGLWPAAASAAPDAPPDIAGSAGIAAGLARADALGWASAGTHGAARRALHALTARLAPDGLLPGEPGHALGLVAQLAAAVGEPPS
jgi:hypothetical protein